MPQPDLILKRLTDEGAKTAAFFRAIPEAQMQVEVYTEGAPWRVRDLLAHLVSAERAFHFYGEQILAGGAGAPNDFSIDAFNHAQVAALKDIPSAELIAQFETARAATIALARGMTDADFNRSGRHPWFGRVPLSDMLKLIYRHSMLHERDIRKVIG
jgi:hypothetical protein